MSVVPLELEDDLLALMRQSDQTVEQAARELIVLELYRRGKLSSGKAADLLAMPRVDFIRHASGLGIPYLEMTGAEWEIERAQSETL